ncbi:hypothetical protein [Pelosinus sp. UFO1]|uniref:hypothetical protein n=1 Tax=Pelosinus sp. UFO1 TaxID=484770 RepID=UPI0004D17354|nr:hypothetical protein [Pelosinus sp. UFO1]AIF51988.1 hypothetical protein UFO1_2441 [Pelosinus sp. UFO1]
MSIKVFVDAVRKSINEQNWYAALALALALPDMCSKLESPNLLNTGMRYKNWYNKYMLLKYTRKIGANETTHVFLNADDFYALRCSYLHQGSQDITGQKARKILEDFNFVAPHGRGTIHLNKLNNTLQLQVDIFCEDICVAIERWINDVLDNNDKIKERAELLLTIKCLENTFSL